MHPHVVPTGKHVRAAATETLLAGKQSRVRVKRIPYNLLSNGIKFNHRHGKVEPRVRELTHSLWRQGAQACAQPLSAALKSSVSAYSVSSLSLPSLIRHTQQ